MFSPNRPPGGAVTAARVTRMFVLAATPLACLGLATTTIHARGDDSGSPLQAGAAVRVVNPTRPAVTIGHRVEQRFTNVYADLRVQAMVIEDIDGRRIVWMGMDFCVLRHRVVDHIKQEIQQAHGIQPSCLSRHSALFCTSSRLSALILGPPW